METHTFNRNTFSQFLNDTHEPCIFKFTADWCGPCKRCKPFIDSNIAQLKNAGIRCIELNVDDNIDLHAKLKALKLLPGIPAILYYGRNNNTFIPDNSVIGSDETNIRHFFNNIISDNT